MLNRDQNAIIIVNINAENFCEIQHGLNIITGYNQTAFKEFKPPLRLSIVAMHYFV